MAVGPAKSTVAAAVMAIAVTVPFLAQGVISAVQADDPASLPVVREALVSVGAPAQAYEASVLLWLFAGLFLTASVTALVLAAGVLLRRPWAREGALGLFGLFGFLAFASGLLGLAADPPGRNAGWALVVGLADALVVGLLLRPSSVRDVQVAELRRQRRHRAAPSP